MSTDPIPAAAFYASPRGHVAAQMLCRRAGRLWPTLSGCSVLGIGYPAPLLRQWQSEAYACLSAIPTWHDPPPDSASVCAIETDHLPFPDLSFDRILLLHSVDVPGNADRMLREVWRVLKDDGRIMVIAPNRMGMWAHFESTPFGQGRPYSPGQIERLLTASMFKVERHEAALFVPPTNFSLILRGAVAWERIGHALFPHLAGATITEAVKDAYAAMPTMAPARRTVVLPEAA